jgi:LytS/YehU family sensor histidine kinase
MTVSVIGYLLGEMPMEVIKKTVSFGHFMSVIELNFLVYFSMIGIIHVYYYVKRVKQMEQQKSKLESHLANSKLNALKAQLQPHFIFNTLNSISSLIEEDKERSQNLIADFGDLLRDILANTDQHLIPLEHELAILDKFMAIMDIRFSDHLVFETRIDPGLGQALVPHLFLQPLVENAIKHGYSMNHTTLKVVVDISRDGDILRVQVSNNGKPLSGSLETQLRRGTGLQNTRDRLETQFGPEFRLDLRNQENGKGVVLEVEIPFQMN